MKKVDADDEKDNHDAVILDALHGQTSFIEKKQKQVAGLSRNSTFFIDFYGEICLHRVN